MNIYMYRTCVYTSTAKRHNYLQRGYHVSNVERYWSSRAFSTTAATTAAAAAAAAAFLWLVTAVGGLLLLLLRLGAEFSQHLLLERDLGQLVVGRFIDRLAPLPLLARVLALFHAYAFTQNSDDVTTGVYTKVTAKSLA